MSGFIVLVLVFLGMVGLYLLTFFLNKQSTKESTVDEIKEVPHHHHSGGCACGHSSGSCSSSNFKLFEIEKEKSDESIKNFNIKQERK